jgi:hypothetical protein
MFGIQKEQLQKVDLMVLRNVYRKVEKISQELPDVPDSVYALNEFDGVSVEQFNMVISDEFWAQVERLSLTPEADRLSRMEMQYFVGGLTGPMADEFGPLFEEACGVI